MKLLVIILVMISHNVLGQNFSNSDLEGTTGMSSTPPGWYTVSYTDSVCLANSNLTASPDITSTQGPISAIGIAGIPHSGNTFVSGLISAAPGAYYQEGIRQTLTGLIPGKHYNITFYQSIVKQNNALDNSGSWAIYVDQQLAGISTPSSSNINFDNASLQWEERTIHFQANQSNQIIKFLPIDDDPDQQAPNESLRMGIDHITLHPYQTHVYHDTICEGETATVWASGANNYHWANLNDPNSILSYDSILRTDPDSTTHYLVFNDVDTNIATVTVLHSPTLDLGPNQNICPGDSTTINPNVSNADSHFWSDGSSGFNLVAHDEGIHWMIATNTCGSVSDSMLLIHDSLTASDFGFDTLVCAYHGIYLDAFYANAQYYWLDGSVNSSVFIEEPGEYWVEISNHCGWIRDTFNVEMYTCGSSVEMPNVFSPNNDGYNDVYHPVAHEHIVEFHLVIFNRWGNVVYECLDVNSGWDGTINGDSASEGVYFWKIQYSDAVGDNFNEQGSLTLLR